MPELEAIVVDDGSTDGTMDRLSQYRDCRLRIVRQENQGPAAAANAGIRLCRGAYVGFLDGDDLWREDKLRQQIDFLQRRPDVDVAFSWSRLINAQGGELRLHTRRWRGAISAAQLFEDFVLGNASSAVVRRSALEKVGGLDPALPLCCDLDLYLRLALLRPGNVCAVPQELTLYRRRPGQLSRDCAAMETEWERMLEKFLRMAPGMPAAAQRRARSNINRYYSYLAYEGGNAAEALSRLRKAARQSPLCFAVDIRNWQLGAAVLTGLVLPARIHRMIQRKAGLA
jgi:glycosyltransferase involved in cell wall biosynthesis